MKKKLFSALASVVIVMGALVAFLVGGAKNEAHADDTHVHCICGETVPADVLAKGGHVCDKTVEWSPVTTYAELKTLTVSDKTEATDVYVYLANDIDVTDGAYGIGKNVNLHLCLNGKKMISNRGTATTNAKYLIGLNTGFIVDKFCSVTICDCSAEQTGELGHAEGEGASSLQGGTILAGPNAELTIFGGTISGGSVISGKNGGNITFEQNKDGIGKPSFTMYGGTITGGTVSGPANRGGNLYLYGVPAFMYGGTIENGTGAYGGNICTGWLSATFVGSLTMEGGVIADGNATVMGGNICGMNGGRLDLNDGVITGGTLTVSANKMAYSSTSSFTNDVTGTGGNIGMQGNSTININGGEVSNGTINVSGTGMGLGGNIGMIAYRNNATQQLSPTLNITGGLIKNGSIIATTSNNKIMGGNVAVGGLLNTNLDAKGILNITGGTFTNDVEADGHNTTYGVIYNGSETNVYGRAGNIFASSGTTTTITGTKESPVEISNGYIKCANWSCGANIVPLGVTTISGDVTIANGGGTMKVDGGNIYVTGSNKVTIDGITIRDGWANAGGNFLMEGTSTNKTITNTTFIGGVANGDGGSIYKKGTGTLTLTGCNISGGYAKGTTNGGGNIYCGVGTVNATDCVIADGVAELKGGNLYPYADAIINLTDCTLTGGSAKTNTGGNAFVHGVLNVEGGEISYGVATSAGNIFVNIQNATNPNRGKFIATDVVIKNGMSRNKTTGDLGVSSGHNIVINGGDTYMSGYCQLNGGSCILEDLSGEGGLDYTASPADGVNIMNQGYLEINGTEVIGGHNTNTDGKTAGAVIRVRATGADVTDVNKIAKFVMTDGVVAGGIADGAPGANLYVGSNSVVEISGGVFKDARTKKSSGVSIYTNAGSKLTISGGTFYSGVRETGDQSTRNIYINGEFHISGGTFLQDKSDNNSIYVYKEAPATSTITGGYIERLFIYHLAADGKIASTVDGVTTYNPIVSGGFYNSINASYVVDGLLRLNLNPAEILTVDDVEHSFQYEVGEGYTVTAGTFLLDKAGNKVDEGIGKVSGAGNIKKDTAATLTAGTVSNYSFVGWATVDSLEATTYNKLGESAETLTTAANTEATYVALYQFGSDKITYTVTGADVVVKVNGEEAEMTGAEDAGAKLTVSYAGTDFAYWTNESGKIVSREATFTTELYSETTLKLEKNAATATKVVFLNESGQVTKIVDTADALTALPEVPVRVGKTGGAWSKTLAEVNAAIADETVTYVEVTLGGYTVDPEAVLFQPVVGATAPVITMNIKEVTAQADGKATLSLGASHTVPAGFEMVEQGILFTTNAQVEDATVAQAALYYGSSKAVKFRGNSTLAEDVTILNVKNVAEGKTVYAVGYLIYRATGATETEVIYTTMATGTVAGVE